MCFVLEGHAQAPPGERGPDDPLWVQWMRPDSPEDQTILHFWGRYTNDTLDPEGIVDLGTMLFRRGFPNDAVRLYRQALRVDRRMAECWFRIGLVKDHLDELDDARHAYRKCLKIAPDHGWCAFYLALLEEKTRHPSRALELYQRAFESAPELADAAVNPELLQSRLYLGALLMAGGREVRPAEQPMSLPEPENIESALSRGSSTSQAPAARAATGMSGGAPSQNAARPPGEPIERAAGPGGAAPTVAAVSPEASLAPFWPRLPEWILALI
jgi:tetratricopeptide (TPR) repeat protein